MILSLVSSVNTASPLMEWSWHDAPGLLVAINSLLIQRD